MDTVGMRPYDGSCPGERAEDRYDSYMRNRMAAVHALGSTLLVGVVVLVMGWNGPDDSAIHRWSGWTKIFYIVGLSVIGFYWVWHSRLVALADQEHYTRPEKSNATPPEGSSKLSSS
jgi:hypothetical protein